MGKERYIYVKHTGIQYGTAAPALSPNQKYMPDKKYKDTKRKRKQAKREQERKAKETIISRMSVFFSQKVKPIIKVMIGFSVVALLLSRYAFIAHSQYEISNLEEEIKKELAIQEKLSVELSFAENLSNIRERAEAMGLGFPKPEQRVYIDPPELPKPKQPVVEEQEFNLFAHFCDLVHPVVMFIDGTIEKGKQVVHSFMSK